MGNPRLVLPALLAGLLASCAAQPLRRFEFERPLMGTRFRIVLYAPDESLAHAASAAAFLRLDEIDAALSDYDPESELSRLGRASSERAPTGPLPVSETMCAVLGEALALAERTGGAFDPTVGPLVRLWRRAARQEERPSAARLASARRSVGWRHVVLDRSARTVELRLAGMRLDLGGVAKGWALDEALRVLADHGIQRALVDGGGDVAVGRAPPGLDGWRILVSAFEREAGDETLALVVEHAAVATSGDAFRYFELEGVRYSHVVDPRSGLALEGRAAATVIARTGARADALASALCVLPADEGLAIVSMLPGTEARLVRIDGEGPAANASSGFRRFEDRGPPEMNALSRPGTKARATGPP